MRTRYWLIAIVLAHLAIGIAYAACTPYRTPGLVMGKILGDIGAPDERAHVGYVAYIASGRGLPVLHVHRAEAGYEFHQPPLFYFLEAGWSKLLRIDNLQSPHAGLPLRALNVLFGCGTAVGAFFIAWWGLGRRDVGLFAATFCALLPMECAVSGAISNDPLLIVLSTWVVAACVRVATRGWDVKRAALIGALAGLALLTKSSAIALLPAIVAAWWVAPERRLNGRWVVGAIALALLIAAPWWIRNLAVYGDPLGQRIFLQVFKPDVDPGSLLTHPHALGRWFLILAKMTGCSFVGQFGYMHILLPTAVYVAAWAVLGWLAYRWARASRAWNWGNARPMHLVCAVEALAVLATYIAFNLEYVQPQARYFFPALGPISVALAIGLVDWLGPRARTGAAVFAVGLFAADACGLIVAKAVFRQNISDYAVIRAARARVPEPPMEGNH